jgi:thioredoxin reductase
MTAATKAALRRTHGPADVAIIGAGPAGIAAALQLARYDIRADIFECARPGGLLRQANWVENYPGIAKPVTGPALARALQRQLERCGARYCQARVEKVARSSSGFVIRSPARDVRARYVVVASGTRPRLPDTPQIPESARSRICTSGEPLARKRGARIAIIGAGDAAFDQALNLARMNEVVILMRGPDARCLPLLRRRTEMSSAIRCRAATRVIGIEAVSRGLLLACAPAGKEPIPAGGCESLAVDYLLVAIGREPELDFLSAELRALPPPDAQRLGLLLAGDVRGGKFRQASIAAGQGVLAAMQIADRALGCVR